MGAAAGTGVESTTAALTAGSVSAELGSGVGEGFAAGVGVGAGGGGGVGVQTADDEIADDEVADDEVADDEMADDEAADDEVVGDDWRSPSPSPLLSLSASSSVDSCTVGRVGTRVAYAVAVTTAWLAEAVWLCVAGGVAVTMALPDPCPAGRVGVRIVLEGAVAVAAGFDWPGSGVGALVGLEAPEGVAVAGAGVRVGGGFVGVAAGRVAVGRLSSLTDVLRDGSFFG